MRGGHQSELFKLEIVLLAQLSWEARGLTSGLRGSGSVRLQLSCLQMLWKQKKIINLQRESSSLSPEVIALKTKTNDWKYRVVMIEFLNVHWWSLQVCSSLKYGEIENRNQFALVVMRNSERLI